jgi:hypothetical protein
MKPTTQCHEKPKNKGIERFLPSVEMTFRHVSGGEGGAALVTERSRSGRPSLPLPSAFSRHFERQREISIHS